MKKISRVGIKITAGIVAVQLVIFTALFLFANGFVTKNASESAVDIMTTAAFDRATVIENYIESVEGRLTAYSRAGEITELLKNKNNSGAVSAAQSFTERFAADISNLEGIYVSEWDTHVLAHSTASVVGITTRSGDALTQLQNTLSNGEIYNAGIIVSPASGKQIISMYRGVFDENGNPIGLVGGGIFTDGLLSKLDEMPLSNLSSAKYSLVNAETGEYIFDSDKEKILTVAEEDFVKQIIEKSKSQPTGSVPCKVDGKNSLAAYTAMSDHGWVMIITDNNTEVFAEAAGLRTLLLIICIAGIVIMSALTYIVVRMSMRPMKVVENSLLRLKDGDLTHQRDLSACARRKDEFGSIAKAAIYLHQSLCDIVGTLSDCCARLTARNQELLGSSDVLSECVDNTARATAEVTESLKNTDNIADAVYSEIENINDNMRGILEGLESSLEYNTRLKERTVADHDDAQASYDEIKESVDKAINSLKEFSKINTMVGDIIDVARQTRILSLNAAIEAARAGESGKGFAVVAEEVGTLAGNSGETAENIHKACDDMKQSIIQVKNCFDRILEFFKGEVDSKSIEANGEFIEAISGIESRIFAIKDSAGTLSESVGNISEDLTQVRNASRENLGAVSGIAEKNRSSEDITVKIRDQAEVNRELVDKMNGIVSVFKT